MFFICALDRFSALHAADLVASAMFVFVFSEPLGFYLVSVTSSKEYVIQWPLP